MKRLLPMRWSNSSDRSGAGPKRKGQTPSETAKSRPSTMSTALRKRLDKIERILAATKHEAQGSDVVRILIEARKRCRESPIERRPEQIAELRQSARALRARLEAERRLEQVRRLAP